MAVSLGGTALGSFPVDNTIGTAIYDHYGTATVSVQLPANAPIGANGADPHGCDDGHVGHGADHDREGRVHGHRDRALGDQAEEGDRADLGGRARPPGRRRPAPCQAVINGTVVDTAQLAGGAATLEVGPFDDKGVVGVEIRYLGDTVTG